MNGKPIYIYIEEGFSASFFNITPEITSARNTSSLFSLGKCPMLLKYLLRGPEHHSSSLEKGQGSDSTLQWKKTDVHFKCHGGVNLRARHCRAGGETCLDAEDDDFPAQETQSLSL